MLRPSEPADHRAFAAAIIEGTRNLIGANAGAVFVVWALLTGLNVVIDTADPEYTRMMTLPASFASTIAQYWLTRTLLARLDLLPAAYRPRLLATWGLCFLSVLGILLGLVLLVLPGLYLASRWLPAVPILIGEDATVMDALRRSWHETADYVWQIMIVIVVIVASALILILVVELGTGADTQSTLLNSFIADGAIYAACAVGWVAAVAIYMLVVRSADRLEDVFN